MPFFANPPVCPKCKEEASYGETKPQSKPELEKGNTGRPYYGCRTKACREFYCFDDNRGIHHENPLCFCGEPCRRIVNTDRSSTSDSLILVFQCARAECGCYFPEQDQGSLKKVAQAEIQNWIELGIL